MKGKGSKGKSQFGYFSEEQLNTLATALRSASTDGSSTTTASPSEVASVAPSSASATTSSSRSAGHSCAVASHGLDLDRLLNSTSLREDLESFFSSSVADTEIVADNSTVPIFSLQLCSDRLNSGTEPFSPLLGAELVLNDWRPGSLNLIDLPELSVEFQLIRTRESLVNMIMSNLSAWDASTTRSMRMDKLIWTMSQQTVPTDCPHKQFVSVRSFDTTIPHSEMTSENIAHGMTDNVGSHTDVESSVCAPGSCCHQQFTFINDSSTQQSTSTNHVKPSDFPIFRAGVDSCCTATCTNSIGMLTNIKKCSEKFKVADGKESKCIAIGDMPVLAKDSNGEICRFVLNNVRLVPDFKYTLISVDQIWREQKINSLFADSKQLVLADGTIVPFDPRFHLCAVTLVSELLLSKSLAAQNCKPHSKCASQECHVGFHNLKSTAHIARLPAAQAGEMLHRRCHMGTNKIRSLPQISNDAPKILTSATPCTCVHCAAAQIKRASHSSTLDTPATEPGDVHVDLKGPFPISAIGKYRYAAIFIDEYTRFVFIEFLHDKSEVIDATRRVMAKFVSLSGTPVDSGGIALNRSRVRRLHRDHEGGLESSQFEAFRAKELLHSTTSAPHDHDLNPISESTINVLSTLATSYKSQSGMPIGFWPEVFRYAVDWHNSVPQQSIGSSTADHQVSPYQRFTFKQPKVMDLAAFGSRAVVLKPPQRQSKTTLSSRGWVGMYLGRSSDAVGTYEVWVPEIGRKVRSSSVVVDEEFFPWLGPKAHQPLLSSMNTSKFIADHLGGDVDASAVEVPTEYTLSQIISMLRLDQVCPS